MDPERTESRIRVGLVVSHYRITRQLGSGGIGEVWLAEDTALHRPVALKFLSITRDAGPDCRERLEREARAAAQLNHPNIVTIYDVGDYAGGAFIAMEYVDGETLDRKLERGPLALSDIVNLGRQLAGGLACAHDAGTTHGDIKPNNIIVTDDGTAKILDFGLARPCLEAPSAQGVETAGTPAYCSPEQARGTAPDAKSDLFSLGIVLYEMATGRRPFTGEYEAAVLYAIANEEPRPLRDHNSDLPEELVALVAELLQKSPQSRPSSATEVAERLARIERKEEPSGFHPHRIVLTGLAVVAAVILVGLWFVFGPTGRKANAQQPFLAVLPFDNLGQPEDEYFADGVTDAVTTQLAKSRRLNVISRASAMQYRGSEKRVQGIGEELGVDYAVTGTVNWDRAGGSGKLRISAALVRISDDTYLWADSYERPLARIFELQSEIAEKVAGALHAALPGTASDLTREGEVNLDAYDFYLRGNQYFNRSWDREDIAFALQMYVRATELDSNYAPAFAMLCRAEESMYWEYFDRSEERRSRARRAVDRALALDPESVDGRLALGYYYYHCELKYDSALAEFNRGLASQPEHVELLNAVGAVERRQGRLDLALRSFLKALQLDPRSYLKAFDVALTHMMMRNLGEANRYLGRTTALAPDWPLPYLVEAWLPILRNGDTATARRILTGAPANVDLAGSPYYWWLMRVVESDLTKVLGATHLGSDTAGFYLHRAQLYRLLRRADLEAAYADSARQVLEPKVQQLPEDAKFNSQLGLAYAGLRRQADALQFTAKGAQLLPTSRDAFDALFLLVNLAEALVIFGEYDQAASQLDMLMQLPGFVSAPYLKLDPLWKPLHDNPGFKKLVGGR